MARSPPRSRAGHAPAQVTHIIDTAWRYVTRRFTAEQVEQQSSTISLHRSTWRYDVARLTAANLLDTTLEQLLARFTVDALRTHVRGAAFSRALLLCAVGEAVSGQFYDRGSLLGSFMQASG